MMSKKRFIEFDGMRSMAILLVLFHHLEIDQRVPLFADLFRYLALGIFIFISGYLLASNSGKLDSWREIKGFMFKRAVRILPLYIVALLVFIKLLPGIDHSMNTLSFAIHCLGLDLIFSHPPQCDPVLTLWYIGLIMPYYAFFAVFTRLTQNPRRNRSAWILVALFPVFFVFLRYCFGISDKRLILYFATFIAGVVGAKYNVLNKITLPKTIFSLMIFLTVSFFYVYFIYPPTIKSSRPTSLFSFISLGALLCTNIIMISFIPVSYTLFKTKWLARFSAAFSFIAYASYCMYLFHRPFWWGISKLYQPTSTMGQQIFNAAIIPLLIVFCFYLQKAYDTCINWGMSRKEPIVR